MCVFFNQHLCFYTHCYVRDIFLYDVFIMVPTTDFETQANMFLVFFVVFFCCCFWLAKKLHSVSLRQFSKNMGFNCGLKKLLAWIGQNIKLINGWSLTFSLWLNPHRSVLTLWPPAQHCFCPHFLQIGPEALRTPLDPWSCSGVWHQDIRSRFFKFCKLWCRASKDQTYWSRAKRLAKTEIRGVYRSSQHL